MPVNSENGYSEKPEESQLAQKRSEGNLRDAFKKSVCGYSWTEYEKNRRGNGNPNSVAKKLEMAIQFMESQYRSNFGYMTQVSSDSLLKKSTDAIPNIFDTCVIVDVMLSNGITLSPVIIESVRELILRNQTNYGLWNYFLQDYKIIPDDIDAASNAVLALLSCGLDKREGANMAKGILDRAVFHEDGLVDVYFPKQFASNVNASQHGNIVLEKWPEVCRVDLCVTANFVYLQEKVGNPKHEKLLHCYALLEAALDALERKEYTHPVIASYAKHYDDIDVICFFISRLINQSYHAQKLFQEKLCSILKYRLTLKSENPISIACRILGAVNAGLLENEYGRTMITMAALELLSIQSRSDFSFAKAKFYSAHKTFHFGSEALSTAFAVAAIKTVKDNLGFSNLV